LRGRRIPLNNSLQETLAWLKERSRSDFVFINQRTGQRFWQRPDILKGLCKKAGVKYFPWHSLRHLAASQLAAFNTPILDVSRYLGHASIGTSEIYLHSLEKGLQEASNNLDGLLK
jgi:site-specific recombinase XerD